MRAMRIMVMFDLPTGSKEERRSYSEFRKFLIKDGYVMEQFSVYSRVTLGRDVLQTHLDRLRRNLPLAGSVTVLTLTEKQFEDRLVLLSPLRGMQNQTQDYGAQMTLVF